MLEKILVEDTHRHVELRTDRVSLRCSCGRCLSRHVEQNFQRKCYSEKGFIDWIWQQSLAEERNAEDV